MKKVLLTIVTFSVGLTIAVTGLTSCNFSKAKEVGGIEDTTPIVKVAKATTQSIQQIIDFSGNIEPFAKNNISSSAAQRIEKIMVEVGDVVKKGQLLVQMENINYAQAKIQLDNLENDLQRTEALYKSGGISKQSYDQLKAQVEVSRESIANLGKNTQLISPIDGIVTARNFDNGDLNMGQPILTIMQLKPVKILINISEEFFPQVALGTKVSITLDVYQGQEFEGKVSLIYPTIDPATRTFQAQVSIDNPDMKIRPGMFARVKVNFGLRDRVMVPDQAIIKQSGTNNRYVYTINKDNVVTYTQVAVGKRMGSHYEILNGIEDGQMVVTAGQARLLDQVKVRIDSSENF